MISEEQLEQRLFDKLLEYPYLESFFLDKLTRRVKQPNWVYNGLIILLLLSHRDNLDLIETMLKRIADFDPRLLNDLKQELRGDEKDFDNQLKDLFAELNGAYRLISEGCISLRKIPRLPNKHTPDFELCIEGTTQLVEVKNLRAPDEFPYHVTDQFEIDRLRHQELGGHRIHLQYHIPSELLYNMVISRDNIARLIKRIRRQCADGVPRESYIFLISDATREFRIRILSEVTGDDRHLLTWTPRYDNHQSVIDNYGIMKSALGQKVLRVTCQGFTQLNDYDAGKGLHKTVLLNWNKPSPAVFSHISYEGLAKWVGKVGRRLNRVRPDMYLRLLS